MGDDSARKAINVGDDDFVDERTRRRWKRRSIPMGVMRRDSAKVEGTMLDKNYERYLSQLDSDDSSDVRILDDGDGGNGGDADDVTPHFDDKNKRPLDDGRKEYSDDDCDEHIRANSLNGLVDDDMDPQYKEFWKHVIIDGNSFILEYVEEDGSLKQRRYFQDNRQYEPGLDNPETLKQSQEKEKTKIGKMESVENLEDVLGKKKSVKGKKGKLDVPAHVSDGSNVPSSESPCLEVPYTPAGSKGMKTITTRATWRTEAADPLGKRNWGSDKQHGSKNLRFPEGGQYYEAESDSNVTDNDYQEFLNCVRMDGDSIVFTPQNFGPLIYNGDCSSDSDVAIMNCTPIVDSERHIEDNSQFRQGLMKDLKRPYNSDEYLELLEEWSRQRPPKTHFKNLRNGNVKSYSLPGEFGKSYQEAYKDLARKLDAVIKDRPKSLNLLRCFFYWLKNVAQEGSFMPWNDRECLKGVYVD